MDPKTTAAINSLTPNYSSGHRQTVPIAEDMNIAEAPPSYEAAMTSSPTPIHQTPSEALHRPLSSSSSSSASSTTRFTPAGSSSTAPYASPQPMKYYQMDEATKQRLENSPGCFFSTRGGCCFSDRAGCCCSDTSGCIFSSNAGCLFSDHSGCFCSDNGGCCFSDNGGCCFGNHGGCCCSDGYDGSKRARPGCR